jgi:hypothetical protein
MVPVWDSQEAMSVEGQVEMWKQHYTQILEDSVARCLSELEEQVHLLDYLIDGRGATESALELNGELLRVGNSCIKLREKITKGNL